MDVPATLGPFEVRELIGSGGMGEVYRAHDARLGRDVALKVLPEALGADPDRRIRFLREARAAAQLNHPGITTIHEVGDADGRDYIAFELVEGQTLSALSADRELSVDELFDLAIAIADALSYAHGRGVIHRDLKLDNVMLDPSGRPKLLDFGLAKLRDDARSGTSLAVDDASNALTLAGQVFGTPNAMSPEQAAGKPVDERSDVFSFGTLVYELGTRRAPFKRDTVLETVTAVIHDVPPALRTVRRDLPAGLEATVRRAMEKDPAARFQSMSDVRDALRAERAGSSRAGRAVRVAVALALAAVALVALVPLLRSAVTGGGADAPATSAVDPRSIAVLPFDAASNGPEDASLAAGIRGDVLTQIARISDLRVIAPRSVEAAIERSSTPREIGEALDVATLLEGTVQRAGDQLRIRLRLFEAASGETLWVESFDRSFSVEEIFAVQSEIASRVADSLDAQLMAVSARAAFELPTENMEAYEVYLSAVRRMNDLPIGEEAIVHSTVVEGLERAIALDPGFADAHAGLAAMLLLKTWLGESDPAERAQARAALAQAERLAPKRLEVLKARALLLYQDREYDEAMAALAEILERDPGDVNSLSTIAALLRRTGDLDGALSAYERCTRINPLDAGNVHEHSLTLTMVGRFEEAEERALKVLELAPSFREAQVALRHNRIVQRIPRADVDRELAALRAEYAAGGDVWELALQCGDAAAALAALDGIPDVRTTQTRVLVASTLRGQCLAALGRPDEARAEFARSVERIESEGAEGWIWDAARSLAYAGVGDRDASLAAADAALAAMPYERDAIVWHDLAMDVASAYVLLGEPDRALELALLMAERPGPHTLATLDRDPRLSAVRALPRWREAVAED